MSAFSIPADIDTPALVVDYSVLQTNLREMARLCQAAGVMLYPHAKTHRTVAYGRLQIVAGARGLTVATLDEAEAFADGGIERLIIAYPLVGAAKLKRALRLASRVDVTLVADSLEAAEALGVVFRTAGQTANLLVLIDSGLRRCGVEPSEAADFATKIARVQGIQLTGILTHEGDVYEAKSHAELIERSRAAAAIMRRSAANVRAGGVDIHTISMGASASARTVVTEADVTQLRPGIYAFNDLGQIALGNATPDSCAARVVSTIISHPSPDRACIDAGSKTLSNDGLGPLGTKIYPGYGLVVDVPGWQLHRLSEEHGWLRWIGDGPPTRLTIGQRVQIIPNHICPVFSSCGSSYLIERGELLARHSVIRRT